VTIWGDFVGGGPWSLRGPSLKGDHRLQSGIQLFMQQNSLFYCAEK